MNIVPIVFAFDKNLILPASVCISSLMINSKHDTFYDIYILSDDCSLATSNLSLLIENYNNCRITFRKVGNVFDGAFEIRGITSATYYRLLIPEIIPEYDKIIYSDVDVIFRNDLSEIFNNLEMEDNYIAGVKSLSNMFPDYRNYYTNKIGIDPSNVIYAGNMIINSKRIRQDNLIDRFKLLIKNNYKFQDMDIINIACNGKILFLPPCFCLTMDINMLAITNPEELMKVWHKDDINDAIKFGIVHYNGPKPWNGYCVNFDIWWEYYRMSPFFNSKFYFDFFYAKLNELDLLPLWKRIKILARYFIFGRKIN